MIEQPALDAAQASGTETGVAAAGTLASLMALFSAAACCVLPLALAGTGIGAGLLAGFVPYRWPLTAVAIVVVAVGWWLYLRKRRACAAEASCGASGPSKATLVMLSVATLVVTLTALWDFIEQPLVRTLGGA